MALALILSIVKTCLARHTYQYPRAIHLKYAANPAGALVFSSWTSVVGG